MVILSIRTDKPEAEIGLFIGRQKLAYVKWLAHRHLAETIHANIEKLLKDQSKTWGDLSGIICYKGPGSFTGLRIGLSVGNALAGSLGFPVVSETGDRWIISGLEKLMSGHNEGIARPEYGATAYTTTPKK